MPASQPEKLAATSASQAHPLPWWGRMETLWLLMAPLCALLYTLCLPLAPNDLWYHVRAGELISRGAIPTQNLMSSGIPLESPYYYQSWLSELGLFWTLERGGLAALVLLRALCVTVAIGLVTAAAFRGVLRLENPPSRLVAARLTAPGAVVGLLMASNNVDLRPQTFSALLFGAWIFAALEMRAPNGAPNGAKRGFWAAWVVILTLIWANTHGAFIISILGLFAFAWSDFFAQRDRFRFSLTVTLAAAFAALINPRGAALYSYVVGLSRDQISQKWVQEWKSPGFDDWHSALFWLSAATLVAVGFLASRTRKRATPIEKGLPLLLALFFVMAARDQRSILWFALAFVPLCTSMAARFTPEKAAPQPTPPRGAEWINAALLLLLCGLPLTLLPPIKATWPWPREFCKRFAATPALFAPAPPLLLENTTPVAAAQFLMKNPPRGKLWTDMVCGSYLTYAGRGQILPLCDPRIEMFPAAFWEDYLRISSGPADAAAILQTRGFSDALLDRLTMPNLVRRLRRDPHWRIVAQNGSTVLFRSLLPPN